MPTTSGALSWQDSDGDVPSGWGPRDEFCTTRRTSEQALSAAVHSLNDEERRLLALYHLHQVSIADLSTAFGVDSATIHFRLQCCIAKLQRRFCAKLRSTSVRDAAEGVDGVLLPPYAPRR